MPTPVKHAALVYQAGIANVFRLTGRPVQEGVRVGVRVYQGDFRTAEAIARGLALAGATVASYACNRAGDIANAVWTDDLDSAPFSEQFRPVRS